MQTHSGGQMNLKYPHCQSQELSLHHVYWGLFACFTMSHLNFIAKFSE